MLSPSYSTFAPQTPTCTYPSGTARYASPPIVIRTLPQTGSGAGLLMGSGKDIVGSTGPGCTVVRQPWLYRLRGVEGSASARQGPMDPTELPCWQRTAAAMMPCTALPLSRSSFRFAGAKQRIRCGPKVGTSGPRDGIHWLLFPDEQPDDIRFINTTSRKCLTPRRQIVRFTAILTFPVKYYSRRST